MAIMYPIYNIWNNRIFEGDVLYLHNKVGEKGRYVKYRKDFEFRTRLPKNLKAGDKVYIYEKQKVDGHYTHTIEIIYNLVGAIDLPDFGDLLDEEN